MTETEKSARQHYDDWAAQMRPQTIEMLEGFTRMGWLAPKEERAENIRAALCVCEFDLVPKSDWETFCYELDLIFVALPDQTDERSIGYAALARQIEMETRTLRESKKRLTHMHNRNIELAVVAGMAKVDTRKIWDGFDQVEKALNDIIQYLRQKPQGPRWRQKQQRGFRVALATKLTTLFESEFGIEAKPAGGSSYRHLEETNDWTKFFQACALIILGERASPDRQAILWEAHGDR